MQLFNPPVLQSTSHNLSGCSSYYYKRSCVSAENPQTSFLSAFFHVFSWLRPNTSAAAQNIPASLTDRQSCTTAKCGAGQLKKYRKSQNVQMKSFCPSTSNSWQTLAPSDHEAVCVEDEKKKRKAQLKIYDKPWLAVCGIKIWGKPLGYPLCRCWRWHFQSYERSRSWKSSSIKKDLTGCTIRVTVSAIKCEFSSSGKTMQNF